MSFLVIHIEQRLLKVDRKKAVDDQTKELEALEARLRETEDRLRERQSRTNSPAGRSYEGGSPHRRQPVGGAFHPNDRNGAQYAQSSPLNPQSSPQGRSSQVTAGAQGQGASTYLDYRTSGPPTPRKPLGQTPKQQ